MDIRGVAGIGSRGLGIGDQLAIGGENDIAERIVLARLVARQQRDAAVRG